MVPYLHLQGPTWGTVYLVEINMWRNAVLQQFLVWRRLFDGMTLNTKHRNQERV